MVESGSDRPGGDAERLGDLVERHVEVVVQDHDGPMVDGEPAEAALELVAIDDRPRPSPTAGSSVGRSRRFGIQWRVRRPSA